MKTLIAVMLALALAGCSSGGGYSSRDDSDDAATMLMLLGAGLSGYNAGRPQAPLFTTCTRAGCITQ